MTVFVVYVFFCLFVLLSSLLNVFLRVIGLDPFLSYFPLSLSILSSHVFDLCHPFFRHLSSTLLKLLQTCCIQVAIKTTRVHNHDDRAHNNSIVVLSVRPFA